jgi:hypothetical protein
MPDRLRALLYLSMLLYVPASVAFRSAEFALLGRVSARRPAPLKFFPLHLGSAAVSALFTPLLCYLVGGQLMRALGYTDSTAFEGSWVMWLAFWLMSLAVPLQLHYTVNSILCRLDSEGTLQPRWLPWLWTATTALSVTCAWVPLWFGWLRFDSLL